MKPLIGKALTPLSLGSLLILRAEMQMLSIACGAPSKTVLFSPDDLARRGPLIEELFADQFEICPVSAKEANWPPSNLDSSSESIRRISWLAQTFHCKPILSFDNRKAKAYLERLSLPMISVHLKQQSTDRTASNAYFPAWKQLFKETADHCLFFLLGDDPIDPSILSLPNVIHGKSLFSLREQLSLVPLTSGFLGIASGLCQAAIFSEIPYVIFKHPLHHIEEMQKELGKANRFPFAGPNQRLLRIPDDFQNLLSSYSRLFPLAAL